ncbi:hypothetical protein VPH35_101549 [Triticum aestivum]
MYGQLSSQIVSFDPELYEETATRPSKSSLLSRSGTFKDKLGATSSTYLKGIKVLSDYMVFLIARRPNTIVELELHSTYEATCHALEGMWHERSILNFVVEGDAVKAIELTEELAPNLLENDMNFLSYKVFTSLKALKFGQKKLTPSHANLPAYSSLERVIQQSTVVRQYLQQEVDKDSYPPFCLKAFLDK